MEKKSRVFTLDFANTRADLKARERRRQEIADFVAWSRKEKADARAFRDCRRGCGTAGANCLNRIINFCIIKGTEKMKLLDTTGGNTKLAKTNRGEKYRVAGLSLFPSDINCPARHVAGCAESCLESAGRGRMSNVINGRQAKAAWFRDDQTAFLEQLNKELKSFAATCKRQGVKPAVRLNVISDIQWEKLGVPQLHPELMFYDYTKLAVRLGKTPANYRLMFSYSGRAGVPESSAASH